MPRRRAAYTGVFLTGSSMAAIRRGRGGVIEAGPPRGRWAAVSEDKRATPPMTMTSRGPAELESSDPELDAPEPVPATTFEQLGVAPELVAVLHSQGITDTVPGPGPDHSRRHRRPRRLRQGQDRVGQDPGLRPPPAHADRRGGHPGRARAALVLVPTRELAEQVADVLEPLARGRRRHAASSSSTAAPTSSARSRSCGKGSTSSSPPRAA